MTEFRIYVESDEHPRTINTPRMARTNYTIITVTGDKNALKEKVAELRQQGEHISEICYGLGNRIWM